ncbi:type I-E CRISPR-associated protein Cas5/CasD [Embleya sp. NPDC050493]|uniref:type I-E CRISPR-associated protein Cas5/CasD n=1 Tax=Embleya sp. NPDC050493 TaxID=3363989 RepID=UPI00379BD8E2
MTHTLLLHLAGPLQTWGTRARFSERDSHTHPTKSGVVGLLAAALGLDRADDDGLRPLAALRYGVRADRPGVLVHDFHTVGGGQYPLRPRDVLTDPTTAKRATANLEDPTRRTFGPTAGRTLRDWYGAPKGIAPDADGHLTAANTRRHPLTENRWYLADAAFLAGLQTDDHTLLLRLARHLEAPERLLWLGRKDCPPAADLHHGIHPGDLETVLAHAAPLPNATTTTPRAWLEVPRDTPGAAPVHDQPHSFKPHDRVHVLRHELAMTLTSAATAPRPEGT